jgi:hypothetical protein
MPRAEKTNVSVQAALPPALCCPGLQRSAGCPPTLVRAELLYPVQVQMLITSTKSLTHMPRDNAFPTNLLPLQGPPSAQITSIMLGKYKTRHLVLTTTGVPFGWSICN